MIRALITGANRGIGLALTRALAERGVFVFAGVRRTRQAAELRRLGKDHRELLRVVSLDVTSAASVRSCVSKVKAATSSLDILINNAAVLLEDVGTRLADLDVEWFTQTMAVNLTGVARVTQAFLPLLTAVKMPRIVNISSGAGTIGGKGNHWYYCYGASKASLNHFTVGLAHELRSHKAIVTAVSPGWVRTDMGGAEADLSPEESAVAMAGMILKLKPAHNGCFLDRHGRKGEYSW